MQTAGKPVHIQISWVGSLIYNNPASLAVSECESLDPHLIYQPPLALSAATSARLSSLRSIAARMRLCLSRESG